MAGKINMAKALCVLIASSFVMMSCAPALTPAPTLTTTPSKTPAPSATPTLTSSPTPTATATPSPAQIAEMLGLPIENGPSPYRHNYRIEGDNLMDYLAPIPAIAAQRVNGEWVKVEDPTIKYGALADSLGMEVSSAVVNTGKDLIHYGDSRYKSIAVNGVFTGEYSVADWQFPDTNQMIKDYRGKVVYRDSEGVKIMWVSMFSPDMKGKILIRRFNGDLGVDLQGALEEYLPGQKWWMAIVFEGPDLKLLGDECWKYMLGMCSDEYNRLLWLRYQNKEKLYIWANSLIDSKGKSSVVPDDTIFPPHVLEIVAQPSLVNPQSTTGSEE